MENKILKGLMVLLLATPLFAASQEALYSELSSLSHDQYKILLRTYQKASAFGYELTMSAIAWQESKFGEYLVNLSDPSFGVFHSLLGSVLSRNNFLDTPWNQSRIAERLLNDYDFSFSQALAELKYWENYYTSKGITKVWEYTVRSYNAGFSCNSKNATIYFEEIRSKVKALKRFIDDHKEVFSKLKYVDLTEKK